MNIQTASIYARNGSKIYREAWVDETGEPAQLLYIETDPRGYMSFMADKDHMAILTPEDCLAEDWKLIV